MHFRNYYHSAARRYSLLSIVGFGALLGAARPAAAITSPTHGIAVNYDFNTTTPFKPYKAGAGGIASGARLSQENGALVLTNAFAGSFGVDTAIPAFDAARFGYLEFDYRLSPSVKVNFFFRYRGIYHGAIFTGPNRVRPGSVLLGNVPDIKADGQWHHAHVPLGDWLRTLYPNEKELQIDEMIIGNWDNDGYLMAGMTGNGPGAEWSIDNFAIVAPGPAEAKFRVKFDAPDGDPAEAGQSWILDGGKPMPITTNLFTVKADDGAHLLQVRDKNGKTTANYPFYVAANGPRAGKPLLRANKLVVPIVAGAGLVLPELKLTVGGRDYDSTSPYVKWYGAAGELVLEAGSAGLRWKDGETVPLTVSGLKDSVGRTQTPQELSVTVQYAAHNSTLGQPRLMLANAPTPDLVNTGSFESSTDEWVKFNDGGAYVDRDATVAASGKYSLRLTCPANAAPFVATITSTPFDAAHYPAIEFDYRVPDTLRVDFSVSLGGTYQIFQFTDHDSPSPITKLANIETDGKWHHATIPLWEKLKERMPTSTSFKVDRLFIGDNKWMGNSRGLQYWIDNFRFVTRLPANKLQGNVVLDDITGVKAIEWVLDEAPDSTPTGTAHAGDRLDATGTDRRWLHLRAQNGAGQWSPVVHLPFWFTATTQG